MVRLPRKGARRRSASPTSDRGSDGEPGREIGRDTFLDGQLLIAMPIMTDRRFQRSVIYMCAHTDDGAMGLIINQRAKNLAFPDLLEKLGITPSPATIAGSDGVGTRTDLAGRAVHVGGPVETGRGFVLHTADYVSEDSTLQIDGRVSLTATVDILRDIAAGNGPDRSILALGYASWGAGQLESEFAANGWLHCPCDPDLVFSPDLDTKYERALKTLGVDLSRLVGDAGHA